MAAMKKRARLVKPKMECKEDTCTDGVVKLSVTIGYLAADVKMTEILNLERLLHDHCDAGVVSLERGELEDHLHFQMVCRSRCKSARSFGMMVRKYMNWYGKKGMVPAGKVMSKTLTNRMIHTWKGMIGYCLKDSGAAHFEVVMHNISDEEVIAGKTLHSIYGRADLKSRVCLTNKNVGERAYVYFKYKADRQLTSTMLSTLTDMVKTAMFVPACNWIVPYNGQGMDNRRMNSYWKCMIDPINVTRADVADVFIRKKEYVKGRYLDEDLNPVPKVNEEDDYTFEGSPPASNFDEPSSRQPPVGTVRMLPRALHVPPLFMPEDPLRVKQEVLASNVIGTCKRKLFYEPDVPAKSVNVENRIPDFIPLKDRASLPTNVFLPTVEALASDTLKRTPLTDADFWESISNRPRMHVPGPNVPGPTKNVPLQFSKKTSELKVGSCSKARPSWIDEHKDIICVLSFDSEDDNNVTAAKVYKSRSGSIEKPPIYDRGFDISKIVVKMEPPCDPRRCEDPPYQCRGRC